MYVFIFQDCQQNLKGSAVEENMIILEKCFWEPKIQLQIGKIDKNNISNHRLFFEEQLSSLFLNHESDLPTSPQVLLHGNIILGLNIQYMCGGVILRQHKVVYKMETHPVIYSIN